MITKTKKVKLKLKIAIFVVLVSLIISPIILPSIGINDNNQSEMQLKYTYSFINDLLGVTTVWRETELNITASGIAFEGTALVEGLDENHYFTGIIDKDFDEKYGYFIGEFNATGNLTWIKAWQYFDINPVYDIAIDNTNSTLFVVGDALINSSYMDSDLYISCVNVTSRGELWNTTYGHPDLTESGLSCAFTDNMLYVAGIQTTDYYERLATNIILTCFNATTGQLLWDLNYTTMTQDTNPTLILNDSQDSLYLCFNRFNSSATQGRYQYIVKKLNLDGDTQWEYKSATSKTKLQINDMEIDVSNNRLIVAGFCSEIIEPSYTDNFMAHISLLGFLEKEELWGKENNNDFVTSISELVEDNFYVAGYSYSKTTRNDEVSITYFNNSELSWSRTNSDFSISRINDISYTTEGRIISTGTCAFQYDFILTRLLLSFSSDYDHDSLSSTWEEYFGLDPNNPDSDGDGFNDYEEILSGSDPLDARSTPKQQKIWRNFGITFGIVFILSVSIVQIFSYFLDAQNKKSFIIRLLDKIKNRRKQKK